MVFRVFGIHNPGVGGSNPPIATIQIKHLGENQVLFLCLRFGRKESRRIPATLLKLQIPIGKSHCRRLAQNTDQHRVHGIGIVVKAPVRIAL